MDRPLREADERSFAGSPCGYLLTVRISVVGAFGRVEDTFVENMRVLCEEFGIALLFEKVNSVMHYAKNQIYNCETQAVQ